MSYVIVDGKKTDVGLFDDIVNGDDSEYDNLMYARELNRASKAELARRVAAKVVANEKLDAEIKELMESVEENKYLDREEED